MRAEIILWVPVTDRLPTDSKTKLVTCHPVSGEDYWTEGWFDGTDWHGKHRLISEVTYWAEVEPCTSLTGMGMSEKSIELARKETHDRKIPGIS